jgi:coenzyme F420-0:L-glutamate ligase / coenzyme F420-1:gamma-L-glutamate ligase
VTLSLQPVLGVGVITDGTDIVSALLDALLASGEVLADFDVVAVTSKIVAKSEGRVVPCADAEADKVALVEREARRVLRRRGPLRITETHHGFVCANAGVDLSNTEAGTAVLLPVDPDRSARRFRAEVRRRTQREIAVVVTDTFGRPWRQGVTDVAIGVAGLIPVLDLRGTTDAFGRVLEATEVAVADEIAAAADLVLGKATATPFALVRGVPHEWFGDGSVAENLVRRPDEDLFR